MDREVSPSEPSQRTPAEVISERLRAVLGKAQQRFSGLPDRLAVLKRDIGRLAERTAERARPVAGEWKQTARGRYKDTRLRAERLANQHPVETIAGVAAAAFVVGFMFRVSRRSRYEGS
jgi:hypothetical protein